jgi:acyl-CoA synthetase (AMP-forming)/AMP-acid ligase II
VAAGPGGLGEQRSEPLHPAVDGDVVDLDAALGEQLLDVAVGQAEPQVPADREDDHVGWEAEPGKGGPREGSRARAAGSHAGQSRCWNAVTANATAPAEVSAEEVMAWVAQRVAPYKKVRAVEFVDEIPKALSGKILRRVLMERDRSPA